MRVVPDGWIIIVDDDTSSAASHVLPSQSCEYSRGRSELQEQRIEETERGGGDGSDGSSGAEEGDC